MTCQQREHLAKKYTDAASALDAAMERLRKRIGISPKDEYGTLQKIVDRAWADAQSARTELDHHIREHGCGIE